MSFRLAHHWCISLNGFLMFKMPFKCVLRHVGREAELLPSPFASLSGNSGKCADILHCNKSQPLQTLKLQDLTHSSSKKHQRNTLESCLHSACHLLTSVQGDLHAPEVFLVGIYDK